MVVVLAGTSPAPDPHPKGVPLAINARFVFSNPAVAGVNSANPITVNGETLSEVKAAAKAALAAKRSVAAGEVTALDAADASLDA
jgi:hypothetical protein